MLALAIDLGCSHRSPGPGGPAPSGAGAGAGQPTAVSEAMPVISGHHRDGDRDGIHGMALFGRTNYFLEHIPMFSRPHDEQLVTRVTIRTAQGEVVTTDFSDAGYSVKPASRFSLDDLVTGRRVTFLADVHRGNFEADGQIVLHDVTISIEAVLVARNLPGTESIPDGAQEYLLVGEPGDAYLTNYIRASRGFQQILRVDAIEGMTPSPTRAQRLMTSSPQRLAPAAGKSIVAVPNSDRSAPPHVEVTIGAELWCLTSPEFVEPCR